VPDHYPTTRIPEPGETKLLTLTPFRVSAVHWYCERCARLVPYTTLARPRCSWCRTLSTQRAPLPVPEPVVCSCLGSEEGQPIIAVSTEDNWTRYCGWCLPYGDAFRTVPDSPPRQERAATGPLTSTGRRPRKEDS
jgi:hypothetical protein